MEKIRNEAIVAFARFTNKTGFVMRPILLCGSFFFSFIYIKMEFENMHTDYYLFFSQTFSKQHWQMYLKDEHMSGDPPHSLLDVISLIKPVISTIVSNWIIVQRQ